jgi:uncharacterized protein (TIGR03545 family)
MDRWIETGLEKGGEILVGAKVDIENLDFRLTDLSIEWDRLQVTNPKKTNQNLFETGSVSFNMNVQAMLRKRTIIDEFTVMQFRTGTPRVKDGSIPRKTTSGSKKETPILFQKAKEKLVDEIESLPIMRLDPKVLKRKVNVDSLMTLLDLEAPARLDSAQKDILRTAEKWDAFYEDFKPDTDLRRIQQTFESIDPKAVKTLPDLIFALEKVKSAYDDLQIISTKISKSFQDIHVDADRLQSYVTQSKNWFDSDYQRLMQKAKLPDLSAKNIAKMVFGPILVRQLERYLYYLDILRDIIPENKETIKKSKSKQQKGQKIYFTDRHGWPSFLIQEIVFSGKIEQMNDTQGFELQGNATGITSQPWIYGKPTVFDIQGKKENQTLSFHGILDHVKETTRDEFRISFTNLSLSNLTLGGSPYFPERIDQGKLNLAGDARFERENLEIHFHITAQDIQYHFENPPNDLFTRTIQSVIRDLPSLTLETVVEVHSDLFDFKVSSNLDDLVSKSLQNQASQAVKAAQTQIRDYLNKKLGYRLSGLKSLTDSKTVSLTKQIDQSMSSYQDIQKGINEKLQEIQDEIDKHKKSKEDQLIDKAQDLLNGLLNPN